MIRSKRVQREQGNRVIGLLCWLRCPYLRKSWNATLKDSVLYVVHRLDARWVTRGVFAESVAGSCGIRCMRIRQDCCAMT
jgi:hypothetical protein